MPVGLTVIQWITDFSLRVKQLQAIVQASQASSSRELKVCTISVLFSNSGFFALLASCLDTDTQQDLFMALCVEILGICAFVCVCVLLLASLVSLTSKLVYGS